MKDFRTYAIGLCMASVCTSLPRDEIEGRMNQENRMAPSSSLRWTVCKDPTFKSGEPNPCPCHDSPETHKHYLFEC